MANPLYNPHLRTPKTTTSIMRDVCIALAPAAVGSVVFFGVRALLLLAVSVITCVAAEALWQSATKQKVTVTDFSAVVTGMLLAFNVSSTTPVWAVILASLFAIIVVKQLFGGIGSNVFNPALMGRLFLMVAYPAQIMSYAEPMQADAMSSATILSAVKHGGEAGYSLLDAFIGKIPGALGETSALLLLAGFAYLVYKKEVNYTVSGAFFATVLVLSLVAGQNPLLHLFSGGAVLGGCFMLTDYNFSGVKGHIAYGVVTGVVLMGIRILGTFPEGMCYAILIANCLAVLVDKLQKKHVYGIQ